MVVSVLTSAAEGTLNGLISLATHQITLAWGFKKDLQTLHRRLTNLQALLRDAERKRIELETFKNWLKSLKVGICHGENVLDELAYEALRRKFEVQNPLKDKISMVLGDELHKVKEAMPLCIMKGGNQLVGNPFSIMVSTLKL